MESNSPFYKYIDYQDNWDGYNSKKPTLHLLELGTEFWLKVKDFKSYFREALEPEGAVDFYFGNFYNHFLWCSLYDEPETDPDEFPGSIGNYLWRAPGDIDRSKYYYSQEELLEDIKEFDKEYNERSKRI